MRLTLNWLKDYVDIDAAPDELAHLLTMAGLEVEALESLGLGLEAVVAARLISVTRHPNADRLTLCRIDTGQGEAVVVCGAPNVREGMVTAYAPPGIQLPNGIAVKETKIRGQVSQGILLAEDEMGLTEDHTGIVELPADARPGTPVDRILPVRDWAFEIGLTPNRPDCASVIGVAREIGAITGKRLRRPELDLRDADGSVIREHTSVTLDDPQGCPRYSAGLVRGVTIGPSPFWMRYRLHSSGVRSINNVVDVTNYVLLECGQPLHAFDFHRLGEHRIVVRRAAQGEVFSTLDGQARTLTADDLMICDGKGSVALAGVMGGLNSEIEKDTQDVLVESACFDPITIRKTSKRLGLTTEASYRFERGVDMEGTVWALRRSMFFLAELAGGKAESGIIDEYPRPYTPSEIPLRVDKTNEFLGTSLSAKTMAGFLRSLEMGVTEKDGNRLHVVPPSCRVDLTREVDLMEEVARMEGYERIPVTLPAIHPDDEVDPPEVALGETIRDVMAGFGFSEIITFSFISDEAPDLLGAAPDHPMRNTVKLLKPLTQDQAVMRTTILPGLLQAARTNLSHGERHLRLFEWGKVFLPDPHAELPQERLCLAAFMTGAWEARTLHQSGRTVDFYDAKGTVEALFDHLGAGPAAFERCEVPPGYHHENTAQVRLGQRPAGWVGQIADSVVEECGIGPEKAFFLELDIPVVQQAMPEQKTYRPYARFPAVFRDLTVVVDAGTESERVREIITGKTLVESVDLFDLYRGDQIGPNEKALTFRICYRSLERTLKGREVNALHDKIIREIGERAGGRLREG